MKAITHIAPGELSMRDWPMPEPGPGEVRIRSLACGICATDLAMIAGWERTACPSIPGHEWCGQVDAVGPGVDPSSIGRRCVGDNIFPDGREVGFELPGGYAQFFVTRANLLFFLPDTIPAHVAALAEPLAVCIRATQRISQPGGPVLIFGDGPIGLIALMLLKERGFSNLWMVGGKTSHLELAQELGARVTLNYQTFSDLADGLRGALSIPPTTILEASGAPAALQAAVDLIPRGGRIIVMGDYGAAHAGFLWNDLLHREIELIGSCTGTGAWPEAVQRLISGCLPLERTVTHVFSSQSFQEAFTTVRENAEDAVKVILQWP
jgi:threonine dehydrogenase-like Zn-dependent dehydrogenase